MKFEAWIFGGIAIFIIICCTSLWGSVVFAIQEPTSDPVFQIDPYMHIGEIRMMSVDADQKILVTASLDKTLRVWDAISGELIRTLRVPVSKGRDGKLYATALSPDGKIVAVGGLTGVDWDQKKTSIYVFEVSTGDMFNRISNLPNTILHMAWSKDGKYLAVVFGKDPKKPDQKSGLRVYRVSDWTEIACDIQYGASAYGVDFSSDGRLVTTCWDGYLRLYDSRFCLIQKKRVERIGNSPYQVRFSPDDTKIAVGFAFYYDLIVVSSKDLHTLYQPDLTGIDNGDLRNVAWSKDGSYLYAGGGWKIQSKHPIRRWSERGQGDYVNFSGCNGSITGIIARHPSGIFLSTAHPEIGAFKETGKRVWAKTILTGQFDNIFYGNFYISPDARTVYLGTSPMGRSPVQFSFDAQKLNFNPKTPENLYPPLMEHDDFKISNWERSYQPFINGFPAEIIPNDICYSAAITLDAHRCVLGTAWNLYMFDERGNKIWSRSTSSAVYGVNISRDLKWIVAAMSDGTIRWYNLDNGHEVMMLFFEKKERQWIVWTPMGYYISSPRGDRLIGWQLNNGKEKEADFYRAIQFERIFYYPKFVFQYFLNRGDLGQTYKEIEQREFDIKNIRKIAPPKIRITLKGITTEDKKGHFAHMHLYAKSDSVPMKDYNVFVNNLPTITYENRGIHLSAKRQFEKDLKIPLPHQDNHIRFEVFNGKSMGIMETDIKIHKGNKMPNVGDLYILAVGINHFPYWSKEDLAFAVQDVDAFGKYMKTMQGNVFQNVYFKKLTDNTLNKPDKQNILRALDLFKKNGY